MNFFKRLRKAVSKGVNGATGKKTLFGRLVRNSPISKIAGAAGDAITPALGGAGKQILKATGGVKDIRSKLGLGAIVGGGHGGALGGIAGAIGNTMQQAAPEAAGPNVVAPNVAAPEAAAPVDPEEEKRRRLAQLAASARTMLG